ncbi:hypothetical protein [Pantoea ananatis]|uniref:hypothetical protein n=1 Tax=Pantoea ananas TaxID=553 RepID=UPI003C208EC0
MLKVSVTIPGVPRYVQDIAQTDLYSVDRCGIKAGLEELSVSGLLAAKHKRLKLFSFCSLLPLRMTTLSFHGPNTTDFVNEPLSDFEREVIKTRENQ